MSMLCYRRNIITQTSEPSSLRSVKRSFYVSTKTSAFFLQLHTGHFIGRVCVDRVSLCAWWFSNEIIFEPNRKKRDKEEYLYSAFYILHCKNILTLSGMDHTVLPANTSCLPLLRKRSPDGATPNWGKRHPNAAYYLSIDPKGWKAELAWLVDL